MASPFDDDIDMFGNFGSESEDDFDSDSDEDFGFGKSFNNSLDDSDNDDSIDMDDSFDDAPIKSQPGPKMEEAKAKDIKKTAFMLIGIGLIILIIAVLGIRIVKSAKAEKSSTNIVQNETSYKEENNKNFGSSRNVESNVSSNTVNTINSWQEVNLQGVDLGDTWIDSTFTITDLKHYALVTNTYNDKQVKSVAKGNISGLVGTYEMEIPTYMALKLSVGTSFKIKYQIKEQNGYKLICEIKY